MPVCPIVAQPRPQIVRSPGGAPATSIGPIKLQSSWQIRELQVIHTQPGPRPNRLLLGTLGDQGFRVVKPIPVEVEYREGVITSWQEIDEFGTGPSVSSSAEDLGRTVAELYRSLRADQNNLGPEMQRIWTILQEHIVPRTRK